MKTLALMLLFIAAAPTTAALTTAALTTAALTNEAPSTAAPTTASAAKEKKPSLISLKEIKVSVDRLYNALEDKAMKMMVYPAFTRGQCTEENFYTAAMVLQQLKAETLGIEENDWQLPRLLMAYARYPEPDRQIQLMDLLRNIRYCAVKNLAKEHFLKPPAPVLSQSTTCALDSAVTPPDQVLPEPTQQPSNLLSTPMESHSVSTTRPSQDSLSFCLRLESLE